MTTTTLSYADRAVAAHTYCDPRLQLLANWEFEPQQNWNGLPTTAWQRLAFACQAADHLQRWLTDTDPGEFDNIDDESEAEARDELVTLYGQVDFALADFAAGIRIYFTSIV